MTGQWRDRSGNKVERSSPPAAWPLRRVDEQPEREDEMEDCERCQGNGEIVTDWERYLHGREGDKGDEAVAECPDCDGTGRAENVVVPIKRKGGG